MEKNKLILLRGYPGSGKTTLGRALADQAGFRFIDHNILLNTICAMIGGDEGIYEEIHQMELALAEQVLSQSESVIVARGFTKRSQLEPYLALARKLKAEAVVVRLNVPFAILSQRVASSERQTNAMSINSFDQLQEWIKQHPFETSVGEVMVDATKPITEIIKTLPL